MNFGIVIFPPKDVQDAANSYRKRFDPHYSLIQPHLTIRESESWDPPTLANAVERLSDVAAKLPPVEVKLNRFSTFYPVSNVVYMALENPKPLERLHEAVCDGPLAVRERKYSFTPHLTVAQGVGGDEMHDIYSSLRPIPLAFSFVVDRLHLLYQTDNGAWTAHQTFLLQG
ncbi:phosphoesterase [Paenibacillus antri]|uniref:Putative phosphoesterase FE782_20815 n=1 Tax=Paenibacillus antri TaxID=2582848 RepID=A0A5R9GBF8_9BACL|nr:2'-5' RNA ligase family protein [Paenibacillus antri]TLS50464.1 phosphoesterase [Paenibacillus antri]